MNNDDKNDKGQFTAKMNKKKEKEVARARSTL